jgi:hypothetical protein
MFRSFTSLIAGLLLCLTGMRAGAHPMVQNSMWVMFAPEHVKVTLSVSLKEIAVSQQLPDPTGGAITPQEAQTAADWNKDYVLRHLFVAADGKELTGTVTGLNPPAVVGSDPEQVLFEYELDYALPPGVLPVHVTVRQDMLREFRYAIGQGWDVTYVLLSKRSDDPSMDSSLLNWNEPAEITTGWTAVAQTTQPNPQPASSALSTGIAYLSHGISHILKGYDHLLFVSALVLATVRFGEMFQVILAFSLAHTITLAIAIFTGFRLPDSFVEPVIAGSIVFVGVQNMIAPRRSRGALRLAVAFAFGLVHGLGFAGALRTAMSGLPLQSMIIALLTFSVGVEVGHQFVVMPFFGMLKLGESQFAPSFRGVALRYGSLAIALAGSYYLYVAVR